MRKHEFVKEDCRCFRRATKWICKHCGANEYRSPDELRQFKLHQAECTAAQAPEVGAKERFRLRMGGTVDCLAPDYETYTATCKNC